jgi:hypothetical protein
VRKADLKKVYTLKKISDKDIGKTVNSLCRFDQQGIGICDEVIVRYFLGQKNHLYLLQTFAGSVSAFMNCFKLLGAAERALVILIYQFARRVEENGCAGTDYGTTASLFVINLEAEKSMIRKSLYSNKFLFYLLA